MAPAEERAILEKALDKWGEETQLLLLVEESGELIQAAAKLLNFRGKYSEREDALIEEIADVEIMIDQMRVKYGERIDAKREAKLERLAGRLERAEKEAEHEA